MDDLKSIIGKVATGATLSREEAASAFDSMMSGEATPSQMGGLLMALRVRGETVDEITGAVSAMRGKMLAGQGAADAVSTSSAPRRRLWFGQRLDLRRLHSSAGAGVPVAKHRHRALSSRSGLPTCWPRSASGSTFRRTRSAAASRKPASASCLRPRIIPR